MSRRILVQAVLALLLSGGIGAAAPKTGRSAGPAFTPVERQIIDRNDLLADAVAGDPWLVRRVLDRIRRGGPGAPALSADETSRNPDLAGSGRSSSEASYDLFQLLKRAAAEKPKR